MYIVVEHGVPRVAPSLESEARMNTLAVIAATWSQCHAFSRDTRYISEPSKTHQIGWLRLALAHTVYNPLTDVGREWKACGRYELPEILALVEKGLEKDDDIIQQWFDAEDVMRLLRSAETFEELCDRIRCVCGEFEADERLERIVESVLGKQNEE
jgi:hypothetical protein